MFIQTIRVSLPPNKTCTYLSARRFPEIRRLLLPKGVLVNSKEMFTKRRVSKTLQHRGLYKLHQTNIGSRLPFDI